MFAVNDDDNIVDYFESVNIFHTDWLAAPGGQSLIVLLHDFTVEASQ